MAAKVTAVLIRCCQGVLPSAAASSPISGSLTDVDQCLSLREDEFSIHEFVYSTGKLGIEREQVEPGISEVLTGATEIGIGGSPNAGHDRYSPSRGNGHDCAVPRLPRGEMSV